MVAAADVKAIRLGHPSYVWRSGQDRRLHQIRQYVQLEGRRILDIGCGVGMYVDKDRIVDLVVGAFDGTKVYIGTTPSLSNLLLVDGFELENTGCWSSVVP